MENKIAAIWARVSTKAQNELSLDGQVERAQCKLVEEGYVVPLDFIFKVDWTSLDLDPCPEFRRLKDLIRSRKIGAIGMLDRDRLEAEGLQRLVFLSDCKEKEVVPIVCQGPPFLDGDEGQLLELALAIGKKKAVERAQSGARQGLLDRVIKKQLPPTMRAAYGGKWQNGRFIADSNYGNAILIWTLFLDRWDIKRIGKELYRRGVPSPKGKPNWSPSSIREILKNPVYAGHVAALKYERVEPRQRWKNTYGKTSVRLKPMEEWRWLDGLVDCPIVTWDQFLAVQERLKLNKLNARRNAKRDYLLRGLIQCQLCHNRHYYGIQRTRQVPAYVCSAAWSQTYGKRCQSKPLICSEIESGVKTKVRSFLENPDVYLDEVERRAGLTQYTIDYIEQSIRDLDKQYGVTIEDERRAMRLLTQEAFKQEQALLKARRSWLREEMGRQEMKLNNLRQFTAKKEMVEQMRVCLRSNLEQASNEDWRRILEALGTKVLAFGDGTWDVEVNIPTMPIENKTP